MRTVIVTGASSGIGAACATAFLGRGERVIAQFRSEPRGLEALQQRFGSERLVLVQADLGDERGCADLVRAAGPFEVLVHSAGIWNDGPIRELSRDRLEEMFRVNTFSAYFLAREAARIMDRGAMVFIGSTAGERGEPRHSHYAGSKAALWGLVQSLAQELAPGIRVNLVSPGWVDTPMAESTLGDPATLERIVSAIPLHRVATAEDVTAAVVFLSDPTQRHLTGVDLPVSGGALLPMPRG